jgi:prepilin-type N-terminal cleavage/methylation domain-containing protein/prepilin-type processing-associated H-X9-DG protein
MADKLELKSAKAFTLIEVMVVVAIISLLASVLLPSLAKAREMARTAVCASQLGQLIDAQITYGLDHQDYFVGSPLTTGYSIAANKGEWDHNQSGWNRFAVEWTDYSTPLQAELYEAESVPDVRDYPSADEGRAALWSRTTRKLFHCPSNELIIRPYPFKRDNVFPNIQAPSYLTMWPLMRAGMGHFDNYGALFGFDEQWHANFINPYPRNEEDENKGVDDWGIKVPTDYLPRLDDLGQPSLKVFLADGLRYYGSESQIDYCTLPAANKGAFVASPPAIYGSYTSHRREYVHAKKYSWRHGDNNKINAAFFDGHVEWLYADTSTDRGRFTGPAIHPKYYYPTGSIVTDPEKLHQKDLAEGMELP